MMRIFLLLSALLTAFAAGVSPARAGGVAAAQVGVVVAAASAQRDAVVVGVRPLVGLPSLVAVLRSGFVRAAPAMAVPLYAGRLRS